MLGSYRVIPRVISLGKYSSRKIDHFKSVSRRRSVISNGVTSSASALRELTVVKMVHIAAGLDEIIGFEDELEAKDVNHPEW